MNADVMVINKLPGQRPQGQQQGFALVGLVIVILFTGLISTLVVDTVKQRHQLGDTRLLALDAARAQFTTQAGLEVIRWEAVRNPDFTNSTDWCLAGQGPRQAPYTDWRSFRLNYAHRESFFRIRYGPWNWSWACNVTPTSGYQQILGSSDGWFCMTGASGCVWGERSSGRVRQFLRRELVYEYNDVWWQDNGYQKDTIIQYASGGGNDNAGRALLYPDPWGYETGYCVTPSWKRLGWGWNPYYHGAYGGQWMGNNTGVFAPIGTWYRAIRWSRLAHTDPIPKSGHTILSGTPWFFDGGGGDADYTRNDSGISMHLWFKGDQGCSGGSTICSLANKGSGITNISYGLFLNTTANTVEFRLNFQGLGLQVMSLPYTVNADPDWQYVVGTYDYASGWMRFYQGAKGGAIQSTSLNVGSHYLVANNFSVSISQDHYDVTRFNGYISEFRVTNYAIDIRDDPAIPYMGQVDYWHNNTINQRQAEETIAGGCTSGWSDQVLTEYKFENWW